MCGIIGIWEPGSADVVGREALVREGMEKLEHRGPDAHGVWTADTGDITFGHRRLAVIDISPLGHQPMRSSDGRYVLTFNGEIYNFQDVRSELAASGVAFRSRSDTEVLVEGFARWGEGVLDRLVGQYAFAVWDDKRRRLFLARDRLGEKPLYYARTAHGFAFASEIQALLHVPGIALSIDPEAVRLYLEHQYVPAPLSIYAGIRKVRPAEALTFDGSTIVTRRYWDPLLSLAEPRRDVVSAAVLDELEYLLHRSVQQQMIADVPLGAFLSGGIDSSSVVALMTELSSKQVQTFTIGFDVPGYSEAGHAAAVAEHLGTDHTCEFLRLEDARDLVPSLPSVYGEPFADYSALPTQLVSRVARRRVTVCLSGDGGDELFGGYQRYDQLSSLAAVSRLAGPVPGLVAPLLRGAPGRLGRLAGHVVAGGRHDAYRPLVSAFNSVEVHDLTGAVAPSYEAFDRVWDGAPGASPRRRAMAADLFTYLPEAILVKVDRAAMATSLEVRAPFLDHRLVEWSMRLPDRLVRRKQLLKSFAYRKVPRALLDRPKQGFGVPMSEWFRTDLQELLRAALAPNRLERFGIGNADAVERLITDHMDGRRENAGKLWTLVALSLWGDAAGG